MWLVHRVGLIARFVLVSCERTPTKAELVDSRVTVECEGQNGEAFTLCRLDVIRRSMHVPREEMQQRFPPPPPPRSRLACATPD